MFTIRNRKDLELAYEMIKIFDDREAEMGNPEAAKKAVIEMKREIRRYLKPVDTGRRLVRNFEDGYIERIELPEAVKDMDEAVRYFHENIKIEYQPTYYDCTGQLFTGGFDIFNLNGRFVVYHCVDADV